MADVITLSFEYSVPDLLDGKVRVSDPYQNFSARGIRTSFGVDLTLSELHLSKTLKSSEFHVLRGKIEETLRTWEIKYRSHLDKKHKTNRSEQVDELNKEAANAINSLERILLQTLDIDDTVDWDAIKRKDAFRIKPNKLFPDGKTPEFLLFTPFGRPSELKLEDPPTKPEYGKVKSEYGFLSKLLLGGKIKLDFESRVAAWQQQSKQNKQENLNRESTFSRAVSEFESKKTAFEEEKKRDNEALENIKTRYNEKNPQAIEEYCDLVLNGSKYLDYFPQTWRLEYRDQGKILVVEYDLPAPSQMPSVESYKYIKTKDEISEKALTAAARKKLFENAMYQICIRTIHELFEADVIGALDAVAFNGLVTDTNPATGVEETKVIMSIMANKEQFVAFNLSQIDPRATFKHLRGVSAASLVDLTPIPPVIQLEREDKRFISGRNVVGNLDDSVNLAAMDWEDFEHLVRELFEKEFASNGGEVKVTRASSDGGVDAIAFDPDPIRGGKIVIQAKRYTNVVGVAAVRDLYGTVMNEGATKGILVTTSDYGKDSYEFAKDKPLTLLNGSNLLSLLEKHGHKARINVAEAKKYLAE